MWFLIFSNIEPCVGNKKVIVIVLSFFIWITKVEFFSDLESRNEIKPFPANI